MKIFLQYLVSGVLFFIPICIKAQNAIDEIKAAQMQVDAEQKVFRDFLMMSSIDENMKKELQKFAVNDVNNLQNNIKYLATATKEKRAKGIRSISFFMKELQKQLADKKYNEFKAPDLVKRYKQVLNELLNSKRVVPIEKSFKGIGWKGSQLLANSFWEFEEKGRMTDISAYKRVVKTPDYIFAFLEGRPDFFYTDSIIQFMAETNPKELLVYVQRNNNKVSEAIKNNNNRYVQQLLSFSSNSLASEIVPFTEQLVNNEITVDEILAKRKKVNDYYQLLVNTVMANEQKKKQGDDADFDKALRSAMYEKSLDFYVKKINELHNSPDAVRFQSVQSLRPQDLYYILVSADEEMYTSTYLGLYKRLMAYFDKQHTDSVFSFMNYDKFRKFMRVAATYNTLSDFLRRMPVEKSKEMIHLFISDIEDDDQDEAVSDATDIADAFIGLSKDSTFNVYVYDELRNGLERSKQKDLYQGIRLYNILLRVYDLVNNSQKESDLSANYKSLPFSALKDKNGNISELVLFYGDDDGKNSFNSFMASFKDKAQWNVEKTEQWVTITSLQGQPLKVYANLPLDNEDELDIAAQHALADYLKQQSVQPSVLVHRGHSYHLANTLTMMQPYMKLALLGSCGGYKNMKKIMDINPDIHIIASKQVGSMLVNDPLLSTLNNDLIQGQSMDWVEFWSQMNDSFKNNSSAQKLFEEYVPPYKNVSSFVVKLYNYDENME